MQLGTVTVLSNAKELKMMQDQRMQTTNISFEDAQILDKLCKELDSEDKIEQRA